MAISTDYLQFIYFKPNFGEELNKTLLAITLGFTLSTFENVIHHTNINNF